MRSPLGNFLLPLLACLSASALMSGCAIEMNDVKSWYDKQPQNWDEEMQFAAEDRAHGEYDKAEHLYQQALGEAEAMYGPGDLHIATAAKYFASMQFDRGKPFEAEQLYKKAIDVEAANLPGAQRDMDETKRFLADVLMKEFKIDEAKAVLATIKTQPAAESKHKKGHHR